MTKEDSKTTESTERSVQSLSPSKQEQPVKPVRKINVVGIFHIVSLFALITGVTLMVSAASQTQDLRERAAELESAARQITKAKPQQPRKVPGELIVKLKAQTTVSASSVRSAEDRFRTQHNAHVAGRMSKIRAMKVLVPQGQEQRIMQELAKDPAVEYVEQNAHMYALAEPNDPDFSQQWYLPKMHVPEAWDVTIGAADVKIAVIDSGIDENHPEFKNKVALKKNFLTGDAADSVQDNQGHGTHVAGVIAATANNNEGVAGICQKCKLMIGKVMDGKVSDTAKIAEAIEWAVDNGAKVINLSLASPEKLQILEDAVNYAWEKGVVVVAGAGNCGDGNFEEWACTRANQPVYPAASENAIAVGAVDANDKKVSVSNHGDYVDIAAPGENIYSTRPPNKYASGMGTSYASPMVAGVAGLVIAANNGASAQEVREKLESTAVDIEGTGTFWQHGRVDAAAAVGAKVDDSKDDPGDPGNQDDQRPDDQNDDTPNDDKPGKNGSEDPGTKPDPGDPSFVCLSFPNCGQTGTESADIPSIPGTPGDTPTGTPPDWLATLQQRLEEMRRRLQEAAEELRQRMEAFKNRMSQLGDQIRERTQNPNIPNQ